MQELLRHLEPAWLGRLGSRKVVRRLDGERQVRNQGACFTLLHGGKKNPGREDLGGSRASSPPWLQAYYVSTCALLDPSQRFAMRLSHPRNVNLQAQKVYTLRNLASQSWPSLERILKFPVFHFLK